MSPSLRDLWSWCVPARHRLARLPVLVLMPCSACNSRCRMCGHWQRPGVPHSLSVADVGAQLESMVRLRVERVVLSGGEALLHPDLWTLCDLLTDRQIKLTLLTNGLLLEQHVEPILRHCDEVIVSLDGEPDIHDTIRGVPGTFDRLARGVRALRERAPTLAIRARCVVQRDNCLALPGLIDAALRLGIDHISFLAVDVLSAEFGREAVAAQTARQSVPESDKMDAFRKVVRTLAKTHANAFRSGFIAESPGRLLRMARHFEASNGAGAFTAPRCNAPWHSAVMEPDGRVRPCFFQPAYGNIKEKPLDDILNSPSAVAFRRGLRVRRNTICRQCVCPLNWRGSA